MQPTQICETERLTIRRLTENDTVFIIELLNDEAFIRYIADKQVRNEQDALRYLREGPFASYEKYGFGLNMVELKASGVPIGMCGLLKREELEHPDIGYAFLPAHRAKGYAREVARAVLADAHTQHKLATISAVTLPGNDASDRMLLDLGFNYCGSIELYGATNNLYMCQRQDKPAKQ